MRIDERSVGRSIERAAERLLARQQADGGWNEEMVWCPALTAAAVIAYHAVGRPFDADDRAAILRYLDRTRLPDGSWGLHPASDGYLYATVLCHVAQRLAGRPADHPASVAAAAWIRAHGGPVRTPTWGKAWLAVAGLYPWDGLPPLPPELFRLPEFLPLHPSHWYCHTRYIYLALSALRALDRHPPEDDTLRALRTELYPDGMDRIRFADHRYDVAETDLYVPAGRALRAAYAALGAAERAVPAGVRREAVSRLLDEIRYEQRVTAQQAISPVSGLLNLVALHAADPADPAVEEALRGMRAWRREDAAEGLRFAGALSHAWDTSFALQALLASPHPQRFREPLRRAAAALRSYRVVGDPPDRRRHWRSTTHGGWCFSDGAHRHPVSDCAAEAVDALVRAAAVTGEHPEAALRADAARFILSRRDGSGGFSSYEERRGPAALERLNPSEMFDDCMIDRPYVECTGSCIRGLRAAGTDHPQARPAHRAVAEAQRYLRREQRADGSWPGGWGVCFLYAAWHAFWGLRSAGATADDPAVRRAADWVAAQQRPDGGWGEDWRSCPEKRSIPADEANPTQTAWALLALRGAGRPPADRAVQAGLRWLLDHQQDDGDWAPGQPTGVFMSTSMVHYRLYPLVFPLWALGLARLDAPEPIPGTPTDFVD